MNTQSFIALLEKYPDHALHFEYPLDNKVFRVPATYHITEIKNQAVQSIDCGGNMHEFNETVIQLWVNENEPLRKTWTTNKALSIVNIVDGTSPINRSADLLFEFGPNGFERQLFEGTHHKTAEKELTIRLNHSPAACKPKLAAAKEGNVAVSCC